MFQKLLTLLPGAIQQLAPRFQELLNWIQESAKQSAAVKEIDEKEKAELLKAAQAAEAELKKSKETILKVFALTEQSLQASIKRLQGLDDELVEDELLKEVKTATAELAQLGGGVS